MNKSIADNESESILKPETEKHLGMAEVAVMSKDVIYARYHTKDEYFISAVKAAHMSWDGGAQVWRRTLNVRSLPAVDRAAELTAKLLRKGFVVRLADAEARRKVLDDTWGAGA